MRTMVLLLLACAAIAASDASAQIDPDPDGIGIYFDQAATIVSTAAPDGTPAVEAYLILTNPSVDGPLHYWSAHVSTTCDGAQSLSLSISGGAFNGINIATNMPGGATYHFMVYVDELAPTYTSAVTVLASVVVYGPIPDQQVELYLHEGAMYFVRDADDDVMMDPSSGNWGLPVARINGEAPVGAPPVTWNFVKSLFR